MGGPGSGRKRGAKGTPKGGQVASNKIRERMGEEAYREHMRAIGRKGGQKNLEKRGVEYFSQIATIGPGAYTTSMRA